MSGTQPHTQRQPRACWERRWTHKFWTWSRTLRLSQYNQLHSEGRRSPASACGAEWGQGLGSRPGRAGLSRRQAGRGAPAAFSLLVNAPTSGRAGLLPGDREWRLEKLFRGCPETSGDFLGSVAPQKLL